LSHIRAIALQDGGEAIAEIAGVHHQSLVTGFDEVGSRHVHSQRAGAGDRERLPAGAQKHVTHPLQRLAKDLNKVGGYVAGAGHAHRSQHFWGELDRSGDHEQFSVFHFTAPAFPEMYTPL
jgi:hypothetical protein